MGLYGVHAGVEDGHAAGASPRSSAAAQAAGARAEVERALRKVGARVVPLFMAIAMANHMDRSNLAYAALSFNRDNGFNGRVYAIGTAVFYASFMMCMLPSNLVAARVGIRPWLACLLAAWGAVAASFAAVRSAPVFYALRALLGAFEAGAFPAMWEALSRLYPRDRITKPFAYLTIAIMLANLVGAPIAAGLLAMDGLGGLRGWQFLFMIEGVPSVLLGAAVYLLLPASIGEAKFLTQSERDALTAAHARDAASSAHSSGTGAHAPPNARTWAGVLALLRMMAKNGPLWGAFAAGALSSLASHTYLTYTPILISALLSGRALSGDVRVAADAGASSLAPVALATVPYGLASIAAYFVAASAQRRREHFYHVAGCLLLSGAVLALFPVMAAAGTAGGFASLTISLAAGAAANGPATALVARLCRGPESVVALPTFSSFAVAGGIAGPLMANTILTNLGGFRWLTVVMGVILVATGALVLALRAYLAATGRLPGRRGSSASGRRGGAAASAALGSGALSPASSGGSGICVVLGGGSPRVARRSGGTPKAAMA